jgi:hypothetical protein
VKETLQSFDEIELKVKGNLPDIDYKCVNEMKRVMNKQVSDGDAPNVDERLSPRNKLQVKSFIPIMDVLVINLKKTVIINNSAVKRFTSFG